MSGAKVSELSSQLEEPNNAGWRNSGASNEVGQMLNATYEPRSSPSHTLATLVETVIE